MLDFLATKVTQKSKKGRNDQDSGDGLVIYPEFLVKPSEDLMIKGQSFYAVWDEGSQMWSRDIETARRLIDEALMAKRNQYPKDVQVNVLYLRNYSSKKWQEFLSYIKSLPDNFKELDSQIAFADTVVSKTDYISRRVNYSLKPGSMDAYEEMITTLYDPVERQKIEWALGAVFAGDSKDIDKMLVFYGQPGTGKGSMLKVVQQLFQSYCGVFTAQLLCGRSIGFALEMFKSNPLISIDFDGKLSNIEDNTTIDKVISHESLSINEKHKTIYSDSFRTMLFVGTNNPVKITDSKSGILRRLIDVHPSNNLIPFSRYQVLKAQVKFELGAIAYHCLQVYSKLGPDAYSNYIPTAMLGATNHFYNFVEDNFDRFNAEEGITLNDAWNLYQQYITLAQVRYPYDRQRVADELKGYFKTYNERKRLANGTFKRKLYTGFMAEKFSYGYDDQTKAPIEPTITIQLNSVQSLLDKEYSGCKAQYFTGKDDYPLAQKWDKVKTTLGMINTKEEHYVLPPRNHIVIDFDLKDVDGEKNLELNLEAASKWPSTYCELSKSGKGVHLHYIYEGDPGKLSAVYDDNIDIIVFSTGKSLRRKLTKCNNLPIASLSSGLPEKKGASNMIDFDGLKNEKALRTLIKKNLRKEIHSSTKSSVDFIYKILSEYYESGKPYDVTDMRQKILTFASRSTHQSLYCIKLVNKMQFKSESEEEQVEWKDAPIVFFDCEVYPNLFVICHKEKGKDVVKMINPDPSEVSDLMKYRLIGFNNRDYDNHILYARMQGYSNIELYQLSKKIIGKSKNAKFRAAYSLSYTDVYDYMAADEKASLKKWEIKLGISHVEMNIPWDQPVPEELWMKVADYCANDVCATEATFDATQGSWIARQIIADLSGLTPNDSTNSHSKKIIFGNDKNPQSQFVYTDLSTIFPGYKYEFGKSTYRGEEIGEGGYVYSEPGYYENVPELDAESMHPSSIIALNLFGDVYTKKYADIKQARVYIKNGQYAEASNMMDGKLKKYLDNITDDVAKHVSTALKTVINSVYGLTSAPYENAFKDPRNIDNIVAKRGELFMVDLKYAVQERGYTVAHIKTDSIKIPNADAEIIKFVQDYGKKFGYKFKIESNTPYQKFCLVNDAVYIAKDKDGNWSPKGKQFAVPYVMKTLFTHEEVTTADLIEVKNVQSPAFMEIDFDEALPVEEHDYQFVGKSGAFLPMKAGHGGGILYRHVDKSTPVENIAKRDSVSGTKDFRWMEAEMVMDLHREEFIDMRYYERLTKEAKEVINKFVDFEEFVA